MKKICSVALCLLSTLSFCSWEPGSWKPGTSHTPSQASILASNIRYLQSTKQYGDITSNKHYDVCVLFYENNEMAQVIDQVAAQFLEVIFLNVNVDKFPAFKEQLKSVPTICLYKAGGAVYFELGSQTAKELAAVLKEYFKGRLDSSQAH